MLLGAVLPAWEGRTGTAVRTGDFDGVRYNISRWGRAGS